MKTLHSLLVILLLCSCSVGVLAQDTTLSGSVTDVQNNPLSGITVVVKGTTLVTMTNDAGKYKISVPVGSRTAVFSSPGFRTQEVDIGSQSTINVVLEEDKEEQMEALVTSLNILKRVEALPFSVTQIDGGQFTQAREINVASQLEGRVAGVNVSKIASGPAGSSRVVIRGARSLGSSNQPLYVIDGIPMDNHNFGQSGKWGGTDNGDGLTSINPDDIQSMTVLKGTTAGALYGTRASNGVVMITTKKSKARKGVEVELNSNFVAEDVVDYTDFQKSYGAGGYVGSTLVDRVATKAKVLSSSTEPDMVDAFNFDWNAQAWGPRLDGTDVVQPDGLIRKYSYSGDNWNRFYNTGTTFTNSIALTGGSESLNARVSYANLRNKGVVPNSGFNRDNFTVSANAKLGRNITLAGKMMYSYEQAKNRPMISDSPGNAIQSVYRIPGDQNVELYKGDLNKLGSVPSGMTTPDNKDPGEEFQSSTNLWGQNPYWAAYQYIHSDTRDRMNASATLKYDLTDFLYATAQVGFDNYNRSSDNVTPAGTGYQIDGSSSPTKTRVSEVNWQWTLGLDKAFGKIKTNAFVGVNSMKSSFDPVGQSTSKSAVNSLFLSSEFAYNNFLFFTVTGREDWFSTLSSEQNHAFNPSIGSSFVFTDLLQVPESILSFGKLRASFARIRNGFFVNPPNTGSGVMPNPNLKAAASNELEVGVDLRFLHNRLGFDFACYTQKTTDDMAIVQVPPASGWFSTAINVGGLQNRGIEILVTGTPLKGPVTWDVSLNLARNINKVNSLVTGSELAVEEPRTMTAMINHIVGQPFGMITGVVQSKTADGRLIYDSDGSPLTDGSYQVIGNGVHKFIGGLTNSINFRSFDLNFLIDFKYGGQIYSGTNVRMTEWGFTKQTLQGREGEAPLTVKGAVQTGIDGSGAPIYSDFNKTLAAGEAQFYWTNLGERAQDQFVYDASFIKLRQLTFGYSLPKSILGKTPIQTVTFALVGRNLATLFKRTPNIDPEASYSNSNGQGLDYFGMPPTRSYGFNLKVVF